MANKIISNLESVVEVLGDMLMPVENGIGTFSTSVDDVKDYIVSHEDLLKLVKNKNAIINGDFNIWQEGTLFSSVANGTYTAEGWPYYKSGSMVHNISRSSDVPSVAQAGRLFNYSVLIDCTTSQASLGAGNFANFQQPIEGYNWAALAQRVITASFWVKASKVGIYSLVLHNTGFDKSCVAEYTINAADIWEYKTITFPASPSAGTWNYTNGTGAYLIFCLGSGSTFQTSQGSWQTGGYFASPNQVNACDNTSNNFRLCGVQLETGSVATPFEQRTIQEELALCQRYFEKSYNLETAPGTIINGGGCSIFSNQNSQANKHVTFYKVRKRATPTAATYSPNSGVVGKLFNGGVDLNSSIISTGETSFIVAPSATTALYDWSYHWTANSRL